MHYKAHIYNTVNKCGYFLDSCEIRKWERNNTEILSNYFLFYREK